MDAHQQQKLQQLYQQFQAFDAEQSNRLARYRNIEPESGQFLAMLITLQQSKRVLEIGTSTGYSTLWLADALKSTHGQMVTLELDAIRSQQAQGYAEQFALADRIEFWVGDAQQYLQHCSASFDFILLDAERDAYVAYWSDLKRLLSEKSAVLLVDNVLSHATEVKDFIELIQQENQYRLSIVPMGAGLLMVCQA